jgi:uncharacterized protein
VDRQVKGPYRWWYHTHTFTPLLGGTLVSDSVEYQLYGGWLGNLVAGRWVRRDLARIFRYRRETIQAVFAKA